MAAARRKVAAHLSSPAGKCGSGSGQRTGFAPALPSGRTLTGIVAARSTSCFGTDRQRRVHDTKDAFVNAGALPEQQLRAVCSAQPERIFRFRARTRR